MFAIFLIVFFAMPSTVLAASPGHPSPATLKILHTADGQGEISPCG